MSLSLMGVKGFKLIIPFIILSGVKHWSRMIVNFRGTQHGDLVNLNLTPWNCKRYTWKARKKLNCLCKISNDLLLNWSHRKKLFRNKYVKVHLFKFFITKLILHLLSLPKICWHLHESLDMTAFYLKNAAFMYTKVITIEFPLI